MDRRRFIPSMFHRRLVLLAAGAVGVISVLGARAVHLTLVQGEASRAEAEERLSARRLLPTYRGSILDRHGRVLARDSACHDLAVPYRVIVGDWAVEQAIARARSEVGAAAWDELGPDEQWGAIAARLPEWEARVRQMWQSICRDGGLTEDELHQRLDDIVRQVQKLSEWVRDNRTQREQALHVLSEDAARSKAAQPIREQREAHVVLPHLDDEAAFALRKLAEQYPDLIELRESTRRDYALLEQRVSIDRASLPAPIRVTDGDRRFASMVVRGVGDHVIGAMRDEIWESDSARRPFKNSDDGATDLGGYLPGDSVGLRGIELTLESTLRGVRGMVSEDLETGAETRVAMVPGHDVLTTLDIALQARVQAILMPELGLTRVQQWHAGWNGGAALPTSLPLGTPLKSAAVVMDVESGQVLAMVSMPTIAMGGFDSAEAMPLSEVLVNRAAEAIYAPGSILKPFVLAAAIGEGVHDLGHPIECRGHFYESRPDVARCWIYRERFGFQTHGSLLADEALARSCNMFFYTLGQRLGIARLSAWLRRFGLGEPLQAGLASRSTDSSGREFWTGEAGGEVPTSATIARLKEEGTIDFMSVILGIGQGEVTWTPLQAANAYAMLARGGRVRDASLLVNPSLARPGSAREDIGLSRRLVDTTLEGLRQSVEERHGTGHHITYADGSIEPIINAPGVTVWAKTGTAESPMKELAHAWFVGLVGAGDRSTARPEFVIAVIVEFAGSGGKVSGPIANQIIRALQHEGYLPDSEPVARSAQDMGPA